MIKKNPEKFNIAMGAAFLSALLVSFFPLSTTFFLFFIIGASITLALASSISFPLGISSVVLAAFGLYLTSGKAFAAVVVIFLVYAPAGIAAGICLKKNLPIKQSALYVSLVLAAALTFFATAGIYIAKGAISVEIVRNLISSYIANSTEALKPMFDTYSKAMSVNSSEIIAQFRTIMQTTIFSLVIAFVEVFSFAVVYFSRIIAVKINLLSPLQIDQKVFRISKTGAIVFILCAVISLLNIEPLALAALNISIVLFPGVSLGGAYLLHRKAKRGNKRAIIYFYLFIGFTILTFNTIAVMVLSAVGIFDAIKNNKTS